MVTLGTSLGFAADVTLSAPYWLVPTGLQGPIPGMSIESLTSNNNLAIKWFNGRLYFAFRTSTHHHPRPPVWSPQYLKLDEAQSRLHMVSAKMTKDELGRLVSTGTAAPRPVWRIEQEASQRLGTVFNRQLWSLVADKSDAKTWWRKLYKEGDQIADAVEAANVGDRKVDTLLGQFKSLLTSYDLREPFFFEFRGQLHFYFQQIEGKAMTFNSLRTWHQRLDGDQWTEPEPILSAGEHFWDIVEHGGLAYLSSYSGDHYRINRENLKNLVHLRQSKNAVDWSFVDDKSFVYQGGASEAALLFRKQDLFVAMRLDDGDERGWGALFGGALAPKLSMWKLPARANPGRYDSPRLFEQDGQVYLVARQNLCPKPDGQFDLTKNCPFDRAFLDENTKKAIAAREGILGKIQRKILSLKNTGNGTGVTADQNGVKLDANAGVSLQYEYTYYFDTAKRTALYKWNDQTQTFDWVLALPSSGDTAFPSLQRISPKELIVANYTSPIENGDWSWKQGQQNRTGIYLIKLTFK